MTISVAHRLRSSFGAAVLLAVVGACSSSAPAAAPPSAAAVTTAATAPPTDTPVDTAPPTTAAPRTAVAKGTWRSVPAGHMNGPLLPSGYFGSTEEVDLDGDAKGAILYDVSLSPPGTDGKVTSYADGTFRGTITGVGTGTLGWSEPELDVTAPAAPGSAPLAGTSGDFLGATGTFKWAYDADTSHGTFEIDLIWP